MLNYDYGFMLMPNRICSLSNLGVLDSAPVLVSSSSGDCHFDFKWRTAAACVQGDAQGDTSRVFDEALGKVQRYIDDKMKEL